MVQTSIMEQLDRDAVIVFVGAHPDDETLIGPLLAYAADHCKEAVAVSVTKGESGWNLYKEDLTQTLAQVRQKEFLSAMSILKVTPVMLSYINGLTTAHPEGLAVLDPEAAALKRWKAGGAHDPTPESACARWTREGGDPAEKLAALFRQKPPTVVVTFDPETGYTRHVEHKAVSMVTLKGVQEYNRSAGRKVALYYTVPSSTKADNLQVVCVEDLTTTGPRDYARVARESGGCYRSQFRPRTPAAGPAEHEERWQLFFQPVAVR
jgi:LmbE family N-acetylglucosaminyl deacetylase